ncbi:MULTISPECIES: hypothetical protein [Shewanella]|uniref:hypothetical protein n=1 Tax=Shewanella TaxID=22 RepID=UPI001BC456BC|nr:MULTISPECIES: hypothetical protein [Shewanella]GIU02839.1 hypothetical protein TUM4249_40150 [Shewanella sp. KT0246]
MHFLTKSVFLLFFIANLVGCDSQVNESNTARRTADATLCQFSEGECKQSVHNLSISLLINPIFAPSEKPLQVKLNFSEPVTNVDVRIEGRDMFMGIIPVKLTSADSKSFSGQAIYGSCSSDYMVWRTIVNFELNGEVKSTWFDFLADNH